MAAAPPRIAMTKVTLLETLVLAKQRLPAVGYLVQLTAI
jgi:hypothetical protein